MDTQKEKKRGVIGLGALGALLGTGSLIMHRASKSPKIDEYPQKVAKRIRNVSGMGAVGAGLGGALLATKYYRNKKKGVQ